jgi:hypothetical protein
MHLACIQSEQARVIGPNLIELINGVQSCASIETSISLPAFNGYCSFTNNPTAKAIPLRNNDVQCKVKQQMCETLWNELMHNLAEIVKGARPIKGIKMTRYDVLFIIFPCGSHKI